MAKTQDNLTWKNIDTDTLDGQAAKLYKAYKVAQEAAREAREAFEEAITARVDVPKGKRLVFGYRFGKLAVALADADAKPKAASSGDSLADFLAQAQASGRRV